MATKFASVSFNGKQIIPAPLVSISRPLIRTPDGGLIGAKYNITLNGKLLAYKGSPASTGTVNDANWDGAFWIGPDYSPDEIPNVKFDMLLNKLEYLKNLFNDDGGILEIQSCNSSSPLRAPVRIGELSYQEGPWTDYIGYSIPLEADYLLGEVTPSGSLGTGEFNFPQFLQDANESWQLEFNDQPESHQKQLQHTFRLTHNLTAHGTKAYDIDGSVLKPAWHWAKDWVQQRLGLDTTKIIGTGLFNLTGTYNGWNHARNENIDYEGGGYSVTESWLISTGSALESFSVTSNSQITDPVRQVTIEGQVNGLELVQYGTLVSGVITSGFSTAISKWESASGFFNSISGQLYERALSYARASEFPRALNPAPATMQINRNPVQGVISYTFTYDTRKLLCTSNANILSEVFTLSDNSPHSMIAIIPILGRANGPVLQSLSTVSEFIRTMSVELVMLPPTGCPFTSSSINSILTQSPYYDVDVAFDAMQSYLDATYDQVYLTNDTDNWDLNNGRYSRSVSWTIGDC